MYIKFVTAIPKIYCEIRAAVTRREKNSSQVLTADMMLSIAPIAALVTLLLLAASSAQNEGELLRVDPLYSLISTRRHTCFVTRYNNLVRD